MRPLVYGLINGFVAIINEISLGSGWNNVIARISTIPLEVFHRYDSMDSVAISNIYNVPQWNENTFSATKIINEISNVEKNSEQFRI